MDNLHRVKQELLSGTLEEQKNHFEALLIARAMERANGSVTRAARELGLTHQGLLKILDGRQSETLAGARRPKEIAANPLYVEILRQCRRGSNVLKSLI